MLRIVQGVGPLAGREALDGLPVRNAARPASLRLCLVLTTACRDLLPVPLALNPLPVSIIQHGSAVRSYRAMISGDDRAASRSGYGLPGSALRRSSARASPGPLSLRVHGLRLALLAHSIPSPGWFRALRCLHCAALIFDPWPWLLVGLCRSSPLVADAGLWSAPALCERLAYGLRSLSALPYPVARCAGR